MKESQEATDTIYERMQRAIDSTQEWSNEHDVLLCDNKAAARACTAILEEETAALRKRIETLEAEREWICVNDRMPDFGQTVWGYNDQYPARVCIVERFIGDPGEGWCWAQCNTGMFYVDAGKINSDEADADDIDITHWQPLPSPPTHTATDE